MKNKLIKFAFHWDECSLDEYSKIYAQFGGNTISNPTILNYVSTYYDVNTRYFIDRNECDGYDAAIATWDNVIAGDKKIARKHGINIPIAFDEIIIPQKPNQKKLILPFSTKILSANHTGAVINALTKLNSGREVCIVKPISGKSRQTLNRQLNQFLSKGGKIHSVNSVSTEYFLEIYSDLFFARRNKVAEIEQTSHFLSRVDNILFGSYLSFNDEPCAAQFITKTEDATTVYLDYINSGRNMDLKEFSIGTICMWENIKSAFAYAESVNKKLRFCFGKPTHDYKDRFCIRQKLMRTVA
ncbi:hypothetical protein [Buttiauxella noackiae]|uniref:hypothetical protein n=1 Tax=Buttiauxella noackiae TaxID=82992 RepID=UPI00055140C3|nr:hypothetical protein [Buttiauxella noackiae]